MTTSSLAGLKPHGIALLAGFAGLNALRRSTDDFIVQPAVVWMHNVAANFATGFAFALVVAATVVVVHDRVPATRRAHYPALAGAVLVSTLVGTMLTLAFDARYMPDANPAWGFTDVLARWPRYAVLAALLTAVHACFQRAQRSAAEAHRADQERLAMQRQMEEARLLVLQAQIEPHFLFNTLATVRRLYATDRAAGARMLRNLLRYLAVALPRMRNARSTLGRELALTTAYLQIQRVRMGRRLQVVVEVERALRSAVVPPMMLLTLAENAVKHGVGPLREGGQILIRATVVRERLRIDVTDTGQGLVAPAGAGTGLANVAERLAAAYGDEGQLLLAANVPRGVRATITMPFTR